MPHRLSTGAMLLLAFGLHASAAAQVATPTAPTPGLPIAAVRPVTDTYHGVAVTDPYRYFENIKDPEVAEWMKAHSDHTRRLLDAAPDHDRFAKRLTELEAAVAERVTRVQRIGDGTLFYLQRGAGDNQYKLVMRKPGTDQPVVLVDPDALRRSSGQPHAINYFRPSPSGRYLGYGISAGGSEAAVLHVLDVRSRKEALVPITRADDGMPQWTDDTHFTMTRLQALQPGMPDTAKYQNPQVLQVDLARGTLAELPSRRWGDLQLTPDMDMVVRRLGDGKTALITVGDGVRNEIALYVGPWKNITRADARWTRVVGFDDGVVGYAVAGPTLYLLTHYDAPRFRIVAREWAHPARPAREVVAASERVITGLHASSDGLYFAAREGNAKHLWRIAHRPGAQAREVALPAQGQVFLDAGWGVNLHEARQPGLVAGLGSWTRAVHYLRVAADGSTTSLGLPAPSPLDEARDIVATEVLVPSHDGAKVPMSILHRRDVKLDGSNPVWLTAYASYGFTIEPTHSVQRLAWLERGGVLALANPRGSGVFGQAWYLGGKGPTKPNTWKDVIACAEYLVRERWTTPAHLGLSGGSAGGMLVGRVFTERPDLFAAVVPRVGVLDTVRAEFTANGPGNIPEFGSVKTREGFDALMAMSPYEHVKAGAAYPALLFTHGVNDPRVDVWASTKMAARVMAATGSGKPVLLRLQYDAGHGIGNTKQQQIEEEADVYTFLWQQLAADTR